MTRDFTDGADTDLLAPAEDAGRTWRDGALKVKDPPRCVSEKGVEVATTEALAALFAGREVSRACVLSQPSRWADSSGEYVTAAATDRLVTVGERGPGVLS